MRTALVVVLLSGLVVGQGFNLNVPPYNPATDPCRVNSYVCVPWVPVGVPLTGQSWPGKGVLGWHPEALALARTVRVPTQGMSVGEKVAIGVGIGATVGVIVYVVKRHHRR